tara:strand:+ start:5382 stop:7352 length:1971 start_codon:yes stop_codon:yes gene_type:complete
MPVIDFPSSPSNNELFIAQGKSMRYNSAKNKWKQVGTLSSAQISQLENNTVGVSSMSISGNTLVIQKDDSTHANVSLAQFAGNILTNYASASQLPITNLVSGTQVYVTDTDSLFITDGSGWFKIATVNLSPSFSLGVSSISMTPGGSIDVSYTVNEPEDTPYTISAAATSNATITVHQSNNTISFAAGSNSVSNETITVSATDGVNSVGDTLTMTIILPPWGQATQVFRDESSSANKRGSSLAISTTDEMIAVGSTTTKHSGNPTITLGSIEVFDFNPANRRWSGPMHVFQVNNATNGGLGTSVAIHGDTVVGGAPQVGHFQSNDGSLFVWHNSTGSTNIVRNTAAQNQLGRKVAMINANYYNNSGSSDNRLIMASSKGTSAGGQGEVDFWYRQYISTMTAASNQFSHTTSIQSPDGSWQGGTGAVDFGTDISLVHVGSKVVYFAISDSSYNGNGTNFSGRVYIYQGNGATNGMGSFGPNTSGGAAQATIDIPAAALVQDMHFGHAITLNSNDATTIAIGAPGAHNSNLASPFDAGAVFVYTRSGTSWSLQATLEPSDPELFMRFGHSVSLTPDGNTLAIGANQNDNLKGAVYIFERSGSNWSQSGKLLHSAVDGNPLSDKLGECVALTADTYGAVVAGAPGARGNNGGIYGFNKP